MRAREAGRWARASILAGFVALGPGCGGQDPAPPDLDALRQPSGLALAPDGRHLFVTGGNWDAGETAGTLMVVDLAAWFAALTGEIGAPGAPTSASRPCRLAADEDVVECEPSVFLDERQTRLLGSAVGNLAIDVPRGPTGPVRLLVAQRLPAAIVWFDVTRFGDDLHVECGQGETRDCDAAHRITHHAEDPAVLLPADPSRVVVDDQGYRFAYVPHLRGGALSLLSLDGDRGPELTSIARDFFREDPFGLDLAGGFSVAAAACDPAAPPEEAPEESRGCTRPVLYATHRFWPGTRTFSVAPGLELILGGRTLRLAPVGVDVVESRPIMGSLAFEDPRRGTSLLVVQTTPGALARVDTRVVDGEPVDAVVARVALCSNPNLLAVHRPPDHEPLALVTCYGDGRLAVVSLTTFTLIASLPVGAGANEVVVDPVRLQAYVANTQEDTIALVDLDPRRPQYLRAWARLGLR